MDDAYLQAGGGQYADIIGFHGYVEPGDPVEGVLTVAQSIEPVASAAGFSSKPVWDTELGYSSADVTDPYTQAGWLAKAYLLQAGLGIQRVNWFEYGATNFGTLTLAGGGLNQAGIDYSTLYSWLEGATATGPCTSSGTVWTCGFTLASGAQAEAVWDSSQSSALRIVARAAPFRVSRPVPSIRRTKICKVDRTRFLGPCRSASSQSFSKVRSLALRATPIGLFRCLRQSFVLPRLKGVYGRPCLNVPLRHLAPILCPT